MQEITQVTKKNTKNRHTRPDKSQNKQVISKMKSLPDSLETWDIQI